MKPERGYGSDTLTFATYVFIFSVWDQDVHLGALGADDVAVHGVSAQVHLATVGLVDGDGWDSSQSLVHM